jgi:hypothetical protein
MFDFLRRSAPRPVTDAISKAMSADGQTVGAADLTTLMIVELNGKYSDRKVTYFRVFDPASAAQRSMEIKRYKDFDVFQGLVVRSGHVERDGTVVLTRPVVVHQPSEGIRTRAGRAVPVAAVVAPDDSIVPPAMTAVSASSATEAR